MTDIIPFFLISKHMGEYLPESIMKEYDIKRHCGEGVLEAFIESNGHVVHHHVKRYGWDEAVTTTGIRVTDTGYIFFNLVEGFN